MFQIGELPPPDPAIEAMMERHQQALRDLLAETMKGAGEDPFDPAATRMWHITMSRTETGYALRWERLPRNA